MVREPSSEQSASSFPARRSEGSHPRSGLRRLDEDGWTRVPSLCTVTHVGVILQAFHRSQVQPSMWFPVENFLLREVMGEDGVSCVFKWESSAQLPQFPFPQVTTEEVSIAEEDLALLSQLPTPTLHHCSDAPRSNHVLSLPSVEYRGAEALVCHYPPSFSSVYDIGSCFLQRPPRRQPRQFWSLSKVLDPLAPPQFRLKGPTLQEGVMFNGISFWHEGLPVTCPFSPLSMDSIRH
ncbi:hypothetical protein Pcinc_010844 [Petrolisthes cinctipes]|uniref:Uncharacterized protein n=1 Tax=Petrolisthes cinctipes TaxID=88211 RepID=A0AAE1G424_PETCI|nr:hypothetical protein Pcinc_010844 [Petrolisthes cinctipes]